MTAEGLLASALMALVLTSAWLLIVMALRRPVSRWLGARWAYRLWLTPPLVLCGLLLPPALLNPLIDPTAPALVMVAGLSDLAADVAGSAAIVLLIPWVSGSVLYGLVLMFKHRHQTAALRQASRPLTSVETKRIAGLCERTPALKSLEARVMNTCQGPALSGVLRPVLLLPADFFSAYEMRQQQLMLRHESRHLCRHDLGFLLLARLFRCLFWFNPLVWLAERQLHADQELSCDEQVLGSASRATRRLYGETLLQAAHEPLGPAAVRHASAAYATTFGELLLRIRMLRHHRGRALAGLAGAALFLLVGSAAVFAGAAGSQAHPETMRDALRLPLAELSGQLQCAEPDATGLRAIERRLTALEAGFGEQPLQAHELARLRSLVGVVNERLGRHDASLTAYSQAVRLAPIASMRPVNAHCDLAHSRITVQLPAAPAPTTADLKP